MNYIANEPYSGCVVCGTASLEGVCGSCKQSYEKAWCLGERDGELKRLINAYKFERNKSAVYTAVALMNRILPMLPKNTVVVPVPTAAKHIRVRGYDHTLLMARRLARSRGLMARPLVERLHQSVQLGASRKDRYEQASTAFTCPTPLNATTPFLLVDDVVTTNATVRFAAQALRDAGAETVWVAALVRQPLEKK